ncbi:GDNF family receptor alpha-1 [Chelonia mydas]|uniref:GDNF family receptor alpha-1 n=1 Tax=Chelonia mydas TaxID=8469 RepID=M7BM96_CHEMY|nr:GDNF family receptor alpha-1 [Chelonia mydas]
MFLATLYFVLPLMDVLLSAEVSGLPGGDRLDCVRASDQCLKEQSCSTKYRTLRQCVAGKESNFSRATGLEAKDECKSAMEALKQKSLYNCRCKRGMKKEKNCLRIYWSMYQSLQGNDLLEDSPYEPVNSRLSDIFRLAPIVSVAILDWHRASSSEDLSKKDGMAQGVCRLCSVVGTGKQPLKPQKQAVLVVVDRTCQVWQGERRNEKTNHI